MARLIECIPNVSEGRRDDVVAAIAAAAVKAGPGVVLLDRTSDSDHNRSVLTFLGDGEPLVAAMTALVEASLAAIDLRTHKGAHPRLGAVDVIPFVPVRGATTRRLRRAREDARKDARRALRPARLPLRGRGRRRRSARTSRTIRKGEFEGLAKKMEDPAWTPGLRAGRAAPVGRRGRRRRARAAHRLQHQPRDGGPRGRRPHREGDPPPLGRLPLREGDGREARGARPGAGLDQHDELREDAAPPRLRDRPERGRAPGRRGRRLRDRRPRPAGRAPRGRRPLPAGSRPTRARRCSRTSSSKGSREARARRRRRSRRPRRPPLRPLASAPPAPDGTDARRPRGARRVGEGHGRRLRDRPRASSRPRARGSRARPATRAPSRGPSGRSRRAAS